MHVRRLQDRLDSAIPVYVKQVQEYTSRESIRYLVLHFDIDILIKSCEIWFQHLSLEYNGE